MCSVIKGFQDARCTHRLRQCLAEFRLEAVTLAARRTRLRHLRIVTDSHRRRNRRLPPLSHSSSTVSRDDPRLSLLLRSGYEHSTLSQPLNLALSDPHNSLVHPRHQLILTEAIQIPDDI